MPTRVYIPTEPYTPTGESMYAQPPEENLLVRPPEPEQGALSRGINRLLGTQFGEERYQTWPEKMIRSAATLAGDVVSGAVPVLPPGSRREDFTDEPAPGVDSSAPWWKVSRWVPPVAAQPNDVMMERAQDLAGVAMGGGIGGTGKAAAAGEAVLGSGPVRQVMRNSDMPVATAREQQLLRKAVREEEFKPFDQYPRQEVPIKELLATQEEVAPAIVQKKLQEEAHKGDNDVFIVKHDGKYYVEDGHHTITAAAQAGQPTIKAYVQEIGGSTPVAESAGGKTLRSGMGDEGAGPVPINQNAPAWYSAVEHALEQSTTGAAPGAQWLATLRNSRGVKPEEMAWLGLDDYLAAAQVEGRKVTRAELQDYVRSHAVELKDVEKKGSGYNLEAAREQFVNDRGREPRNSQELENYAREASEYMDSGEFLTPSSTKYHDYQLPGGENYRELLMTLPDKQKRLYKWEYFDPKTQQSKQFKTEAEAKAAAPEGAIVNQKEVAELNPSYNSSHWDEPNILAHVRTNDRVIDGRKSLHLEEVQSDWHQQGRDKGYKGEGKAAEKKMQELLAEAKTLSPSDPRYKEIYAELPRLSSQATDTQRVPDAPFKKTWHELALKRMLRRAAEEGYERLSWTPGEAQAARYDLSKQVDNLKVWPEGGGKYYFEAKKGNRDLGLDKGKSYTPEELEGIIGKEITKKAITDIEAGNPVNYSGLDLKIGGEGMKGFYDQIIPKALEKIGREHGVKVRKGKLNEGQYTVEEAPNPDPSDKTPYWYIKNKKTGEIEGALPTKQEALDHIAGYYENQPVFYIDIPQSLRDAAMRRGFPLFSGGKMFVPHQEEDK